jgi:hypothetical protein
MGPREYARFMVFNLPARIDLPVLAALSGIDRLHSAILEIRRRKGWVQLLAHRFNGDRMESQLLIAVSRPVRMNEIPSSCP